MISIIPILAKSAGAFEYTNCIFVLDITSNNLMVWFQSWSFGELEYSFIAITLRSTLIQSGSLVWLD